LNQTSVRDFELHAEPEGLAHSFEHSAALTTHLVDKQPIGGLEHEEALKLSDPALKKKSDYVIGNAVRLSNTKLSALSCVVRQAKTIP